MGLYETWQTLWDRLDNLYKYEIVSIISYAHQNLHSPFESQVHTSKAVRSIKVDSVRFSRSKILTIYCSRCLLASPKNNLIAA